MKTKKPKKKKALLYARVAVSDPKQKPDRLKHQMDELMIYCQDNNIKVEGIYYDVAGGNSFDRKDFQYLLKDIKIKKVQVDLLLFTQWDRFSRNIKQMRKMVAKLESMGIKTEAIRINRTPLPFCSTIKSLK